jgi:hypothetical protein
MDERALLELAEIYGQAEAEVRGRLRRQPRIHPQFKAGAQVAMRWMREAMAARVGSHVLDPFSLDDPRPGG